MLKNKKGLTLIELLAVIAIIAILFVLLIPQINNAIQKSRETGVMVDFRDYERAYKNLMFEEDGLLDNGKLNKYLDNPLKINASFSSKKSPFGNAYYAVWLGERYAKIFTKDKQGKEYALYVKDSDDGVTSETLFGDSKEYTKLGEKKTTDFYYIINENSTVTITSYKGLSEHVLIPPKIEGLPVTTLGNHSFSHQVGYGRSTGSKIKSVSFPDSLKRIEHAAFAYNKLESIEIPRSIEFLADSVFAANQLKNISIPSNIKTLLAYTFVSNKITNVTIEAGVEKIKTYAFFNNPSINYIVEGDTVIEYGAFPDGSTKQ